MDDDIVPGAQTERRGGAGPVGGLLGGKDPTGRFASYSNRLSSRSDAVSRNHGSATTSPPARVLRAWSVGSGVLSLRKRTEPSAKAKLAPPGWPLPKAATRFVQRGEISAGRHPVVDRRSGVKRDVCHDPRRSATKPHFPS